MKTETEILFGIFIFIAIIGFISAVLPKNLQILNLFDLSFFGGGIIGITAACSIFTGLGCAAAMVVFGTAQAVVYYLLPSNSTFLFIKTLILIPITIIIAYIISRLARGGG